MRSPRSTRVEGFGHGLGQRIRGPVQVGDDVDRHWLMVTTRGGPHETGEHGGDAHLSSVAMTSPQTLVYVHGGVSGNEKPPTSLAHALVQAVVAASALDGVEEAVCRLEDDPELNAGSGLGPQP